MNHARGRLRLTTHRMLGAAAAVLTGGGLASLLGARHLETRATRMQETAVFAAVGQVRDLDELRLGLTSGEMTRADAADRLRAASASADGALAEPLREAAACMEAPAACGLAPEQVLNRARALYVEAFDTTWRQAADTRGWATIAFALGLVGTAAGTAVAGGALWRTSRQAREHARRQEAADSASRRGLETLLRRRLEELYATRLRAWESDRFAAYGELAAGLSHGLKTPLASIRAAAQLAQVKLDDGHPATANLTDIVAEIDNLVDQIQRFLSAAGTGAPVPARIAPGALLEALNADYAEQAAERGVDWGVEVAESLPPVNVDPALLEMALRTIVENALAAAPAATTVRVSAQPGTPPDRAGLDNTPPAGGEWVEIDVHDEGPGIPRDVVIGGRVESTKTNGSGLGLAIARRIVARHGGSVELETTGPTGTRVRVILPVRSE